LIKRETSVNLLVSIITGLMQVRSLILTICSLLLFLVPSLRAEQTQWPTNFGKWTIVAQRGEGSTLGVDLGNPDLKEAGLVDESSRTYRDGDQILHLKLYKFRDSSGAYEWYTVLKDAESPVKIFQATLPRGNLVLSVWSESKLGPEALRAFATWEQSVSDGVASPPVATYLPDQGKQPHTESYALGPVAFRGAAKGLVGADAASLVDVVGFTSGAEAMFAKYKSGRDEATLLLIEYPTPQLAELHLRHLQRALHDAKLGTSSVERKGSLLSIVLAPTSAEYAEKLRGAVNYETEVTWNEPSSTATDPPITSTLVKIIIATGMFMMVTLVLGIAFGGVRVITKRLFPGKVFDRPAQMEVLQLGLSGKPIDPRDMY
jgi:hypothetical protein